MLESACEPSENCNIDQQTFKAYLSRWMAASVKVAPWTKDIVMPLLASSAMAAARSVSSELKFPAVTHSYILMIFL